MSTESPPSGIIEKLAGHKRPRSPSLSDAASSGNEGEGALPSSSESSSSPSSKEEKKEEKAQNKRFKLQSGKKFVKFLDLFRGSKKENKICPIPDLWESDATAPEDKSGPKKLWEDEEKLSLHQRLSLFEKYFRARRGVSAANLAVANLGFVISDRPWVENGNHSRKFVTIPIKDAKFSAIATENLSEHNYTRSGTHSESGLIRYLHENLNTILADFLKKYAGHKVYSAVLDIHSTAEVCESCTIDLMQLQSDYTQGGCDVYVISEEPDEPIGFKYAQSYVFTQKPPTLHFYYRTGSYSRLTLNKKFKERLLTLVADDNLPIHENPRIDDESISFLWDAIREADENPPPPSFMYKLQSLLKQAGIKLPKKPLDKQYKLEEKEAEEPGKKAKTEEKSSSEAFNPAIPRIPLVIRASGPLKPGGAENGYEHSRHHKKIELFNTKNIFFTTLQDGDYGEERRLLANPKYFGAYVIYQSRWAIKLYYIDEKGTQEEIFFLLKKGIQEKLIALCGKVKGDNHIPLQARISNQLFKEFVDLIKEIEKFPSWSHKIHIVPALEKDMEFGKKYYDSYAFVKHPLQLFYVNKQGVKKLLRIENSETCGQLVSSFVLEDDIVKDPELIERLWQIIEKNDYHNQRDLESYQHLDIRNHTKGAIFHTAPGYESFEYRVQDKGYELYCERQLQNKALVSQVLRAGFFSIPSHTAFMNSRSQSAAGVERSEKGPVTLKQLGDAPILTRGMEF